MMATFLPLSWFSRYFFSTTIEFFFTVFSVMSVFSCVASMMAVGIRQTEGMGRHTLALVRAVRELHSGEGETGKCGAAAHGPVAVGLGGVGCLVGNLLEVLGG
jgi:hypothetical protein